MIDRARSSAATCDHDWMLRGGGWDRWRECFLCGEQRDGWPDEDEVVHMIDKAQSSAAPLCMDCARVVPVPCTVPPEPPIGTWVRDRFGGVSMRHKNGQWAPPGCVPLASWGPMWHARGPLVECGKWGRDAE